MHICNERQTFCDCYVQASLNPVECVHVAIKSETCIQAICCASLAMATTLASAPMGASPKAVASPKACGSPKSAASPTKRKHRVPQEYIDAKATLCESKKVAERLLKSNRAKVKREDAKKRRITAKAASIDMDALVKIVRMKIDMPHIECPHCQCQFATGPALTEAHRDVSAGRELQVDKAGKALATKASSQISQTPSAGSAASKVGST